MRKDIYIYMLTDSLEIALNWLGASVNCFWRLFTSRKTVTKSLTPNPKLIVNIDTASSLLHGNKISKSRHIWKYKEISLSRKFVAELRRTKSISRLT